MIIAIDGTSGSGKSTLGKKLAEKLNFGFFSAGALYRAITVKVLTMGIDEHNEKALKELAKNTEVKYTFNGKHNEVIVDGVNVTDKLYTEQVSNFTSKIACKPYIRELVRKLQQQTRLDNENIVMEGRDIGSVIFPDADLKVYVDCKAEIRAMRRLKDYENLGDKSEFAKVVADIETRDYEDTHRPISPLVMCENALLIDTSYCDVDECINIVLKELLRRKIASKEFLEARHLYVTE